MSITDPSADIRDAIARDGGVPELPGKIWFHKTSAAVIDAGRCVGCGGCIAACPSRSIVVGDDGDPTLVRMCTGCSACWDACPLAGLRTESLASAGTGLGEVQAAYSARAMQRTRDAQDGGVVTALLETLLATGAIDGAVVTRRVNAFRGEAVLATTADELREAAGSVYHQGHPLTVLNRTLPPGIRRLAFVGTPCQLTVLRSLQRYPWAGRQTAAGAVVLTVGLFCTRSFDPIRLAGALAASGVAPAQVARIDVRDAQLVAADGDGLELHRQPVADLRQAALRGCDECSDFTALAADLAVGNVGSPPARSTVLVRTPAGRECWDAARGIIEATPLDDLTPVSRMAARDRRVAGRNLPREYDPDASPWISYEAHLAAYAGTERAPTSPPPRRSHHYDVGC